MSDLAALYDRLPLASQSVAADLAVLAQVLMIDIMLAGDNAVAVGMAAAGLDPRRRRKAIMAGLGAAVVLRIAFAVLATRLLEIIGLTLAGGLLLLWVCWRMWRDLRAPAPAHAGAAGGTARAPREAKSFGSALLQIVAADLSMSLDNVLGVAGAARDHPALLVFGLLLSICLMGLAAAWLARVLNRVRWIGYLGLLIVLYVALHMIWDGSRRVAIETGKVRQYNAVMPSPLDIPQQDAAHGRDRQDGAPRR
jgi:YjbE family integral membrane protein